MEPQREKLNALELFSQKLISEAHYESVAVVSRRDAVLQRLVGVLLHVYKYLYMYIYSCKLIIFCMHVHVTCCIM